MKRRKRLRKCLDFYQFWLPRGAFYRNISGILLLLILATQTCESGEIFRTQIRTLKVEYAGVFLVETL